jgi:hypothetical protein
LLFLRAYPLGGGTYAGIEAESNNIWSPPIRAFSAAPQCSPIWRPIPGFRTNTDMVDAAGDAKSHPTDGCSGVENSRRDRGPSGAPRSALQHQCFLTFSLSLLGLCIYWWRARHDDWRWRRRIAVSCLGLLVTGSILVILELDPKAYFRVITDNHRPLSEPARPVSLGGGN